MFDGYWEDIGTVRSFFEANLQLTDEVPSFDFYDEDYPIYNYPDILPTAKLNQCNLNRTTIASGCMVGRSSFDRCMLGVRSIVGNECRFQNVVMMGADFFVRKEASLADSENPAKGILGVGVGDRTMIEDAIIDKNAKIGRTLVFLRGVWKKGGPTMILEFTLGMGSWSWSRMRSYLPERGSVYSRFYLEAKNRSGYASLMSEIPNDLLYTREHEWVRKENEGN